MAKHSGLSPEMLCWSLASHWARAACRSDSRLLSEHYPPPPPSLHATYFHPPLLKLWLVVSNHHFLADLLLNGLQVQIIFTIFTAPFLFQTFIFSCLRNCNSLPVTPPAYILNPKRLFPMGQKALELRSCHAPRFSNFHCFHTPDSDICLICPHYLFYASFFFLSGLESHCPLSVLRNMSLFLPRGLRTGCFLCLKYFFSRSHMMDYFCLFMSQLNFHPPARLSLSHHIWMWPLSHTLSIP